MQSICVVIPMYNEADCLPKLAARLRDVLPDLSAKHDVRFHLIFVDDGSKDETVAVLGAQSFGVPSSLIVLSRNFGKEAALTAGLDRVTGDAVIFLDADLQHPPELISALIAEWQAGHDMVYYYKQDRQGEGPAKSLGSDLFYWLTGGSNRFEIPQNAGDFRIIDARAVEALKLVPESERFFKGLYAWIGFRQKGLPFEAPERVGGTSRFGWSSLFALAIDGLTSFSVRPIRLVSITGLVICCATLIYILFIAFERIFFSTPFPGFASIVILISFFGGMQMLCIGIIGEYIGKALMEAKRRPIYLIREVRDLDED